MPDRPVALFVVTDALTIRFLEGQLAHLEQVGLHIVACSAPGIRLDALAATGIDVVAVPFEREPSPRSDLRALARMVGVVRRLRPDLVNASTPKAGLLGMLAARVCRVPVRVYQVRGFRFETMVGRRRTAFRAIERLCMRAATHVVFNSASLRGLALADGLLAESQAHVIGHGSSNGVDVDRFRPEPDPATRAAVRAGLGLAADGLVVGFVGRLVHDKGVNDLVGAFDALASRHAGLQLLVVGGFEAGDPVSPEVRRRIEDDERVVVTEFLEDVASLYAAIDVVAFPSRREGLPNVPLEAQAAGVPVVAYAATGTVDSIADAVGGRLVAVGDRAALVAALDEYLGDADLRAATGEAGRAWVAERFERTVVWAGYAAAYSGWLRAAGRTRP